MNNDWYDKVSSVAEWYRPNSACEKQGAEELSESRDTVSPKDKKRKKRRIAGLVIIAGLIVLSGLLSHNILPNLFFSYSSYGNSPDSGFSFSFGDDDYGYDDENLPDSFEEFFEDFYTTVETEQAVINIEKSETGSDYEVLIAGAGDSEISLSELYEKCSPSIVGIEGFTSEDSIGYNWGTGIILSEDGLILTNTHVINGSETAKVVLSNDEEYDALLVGADSISDIAILKIDAQGLTPAEIGDSSALTVGTRVAAIGNPLGSEFRQTLTDGIVSAIERGITYNGRSMNLIQTNTALNEGNSGGALFNMYGQVIGVTNMKMMSSYSSIEGIGFAIPSSTVKSVVDSIIKYGEVRGRPSIGITVGTIPENISEYYDIPGGVYISGVSEGSSPEEEGIVPGDILIAVNGEPVSNANEVNDIKNACLVGDTLDLTIWRDGEELEITITLMETNDVYK